jgi:hypothetical protein
MRNFDQSVDALPASGDCAPYRRMALSVSFSGGRERASQSCGGPRFGRAEKCRRPARRRLLPSGESRRPHARAVWSRSSSKAGASRASAQTAATGRTRQRAAATAGRDGRMSSRTARGRGVGLADRKSCAVARFAGRGDGRRRRGIRGRCQRCVTDSLSYGVGERRSLLGAGRTGLRHRRGGWRLRLRVRRGGGGRGRADAAQECCPVSHGSSYVCCLLVGARFQPWRASRAGGA